MEEAQARRPLRRSRLSPSRRHTQAGATARSVQRGAPEPAPLVGIGMTLHNRAQYLPRRDRLAAGAVVRALRAGAGRRRLDGWHRGDRARLRAAGSARALRPVSGAARHGGGVARRVRAGDGGRRDAISPGPATTTDGIRSWLETLVGTLAAVPGRRARVSADAAHRSGRHAAGQAGAPVRDLRHHGPRRALAAVQSQRRRGGRRHGLRADAGVARCARPASFARCCARIACCWRN